MLRYKLSAIILLVCVYCSLLIPAAIAVEIPAPNSVSENNDFLTTVSTAIGEQSFGGMYFDDVTGCLVVNVVYSENIPNHLMNDLGDANLRISYHPVAVSLQELQSTADMLIPYMDELGIVIIDANDMTNQIDVTVENADDDTTRVISSLVERHNPEITVNMNELYHDVSIVTTVKPINPENQQTDDFAEAIPMASYTVIPGIPINDGNSVFTAGP